MRPHRINFVGGVYHVTTRCNNQEFSFQNDKDFQEFLKIMDKAKKKYQTHVYSYCLTNNHVHLLLGTPISPSLSKFMQYLNGNYAKNYNKLHGKSGHFWGERFFSTVIESETQFFLCAAYIENNMVRCGVVDNPKDWKWSSYRMHAYGDKNTLVDIHHLFRSLAPNIKDCQKIYRQMNTNYLQEQGQNRQSLFSLGIILGRKAFVETILTEYGKTFYYKNKKPHQIKKDTYSLVKFLI